MASTIQMQYKHVVAGLSVTARRQVPFVVAKMLTALAQDGQVRLTKKLPVAFDRPTPFTQRGVYTRRAEKTNLTAEVYFPQSQEASGKAQREYIRPGTQVGTYARQQKKTEFLLTRAGWLPPGWVTVPGTYMKSRLDGFGNMPGAYYKQIIRNLQIKKVAGPQKPIPGASQRRAQRMGVENEFFAVAPGANKLGRGGGYLPSGVYKRNGRGGRVLLQYLKFVKKAAYKQRLDVLAEVQGAVKDNLQRRFDESVQLITSKFPAR